MRTTVAIGFVAAGLAAGCMGGEEEHAATTAAAPSTSSVEEPQTPQPPSNLTAEASPFSVILTWESPPEDVERLEVFRDGASLALLSGPTTTYTDDDVVPGRDYEYEVASQTGDRVSIRASVSATAPVPPLRAARVEGTFNVTTRITSQTGYSRYDRPNFGWRFRPRCPEGACNVLWNDLHVKQAKGTLKRTGARYRGGFTGRFFLRCGGSPATSVVTLELRVDAARPIDAEWRATRLVGTLNHSEAVQLGCGYSEAGLNVRARLVG